VTISKIFKISAIFVFYILPIISAFNCNWNEGVGVTNCYVNWGIFREFADIFYWVILLSVFTFFIPLLIYIAATILIIKYVPACFIWLARQANKQRQ
jgi:hypothetical protein